MSFDFDTGSRYRASSGEAAASCNRFRRLLPIDRAPLPKSPGLALTAASRLTAGLRFLERAAARPGVFRRYDADLLFCFYHFGVASPPSAFQRRSLRIARRLARRWRAAHSRIRSGAGPDAMHYLMIGQGVANRLGLPDPRFGRRLEAAARRFTARQIYLFDPARTPPPREAPRCERCMAVPTRNQRRCPRCRRGFTTFDIHAIWLDALLYSHFGEFAGIRFGASRPEVLRWLPHYRRVLRRSLPTLAGFPDSVLSITHLIYALTDYGRVPLPPGRFAIERRVLKRALPRALAEQDLETAAEIVEVLRMLGQPLDTRPGRLALALIRSTQNRDGSWGPRTASWYTRYHTTWTCMDALRPLRGQERPHPSRWICRVADQLQP